MNTNMNFKDYYVVRGSFRLQTWFKTTGTNLYYVFENNK